MSSKTLPAIIGLIVAGLILVIWDQGRVLRPLAQRLRQTGLSEDKQKAAERPVIRFDQSNRGTIEVAGLDPDGLGKLRQSGLSSSEWANLFAVYPESAAGTDSPAMLGMYGVEGGAVRFTPRFPLVAGLNYAARFDIALFHLRFGAPKAIISSSAQPYLEVSLSLPKTESAAKTLVKHIYPSADELPANQLKMYIDFSAPMSLGESHRRIHLYDDAGREIHRAFLKIEQELWDSGRQRFTLILDPGRVKRGLRSNLEDGAPIKAGRNYRLLIDRDWRDGDGNRLGGTFEKRFRVIGADRSAPDHRRWKVIAPAANTVEPLKLIFDEALDRALLEEMIAVFDAEGTRVGGRIEIADGEMAWNFSPDSPWRQGDYSLRVDENLEDRAGNNLRHPFDVDLSAQSSMRQTRSHLQIQVAVATGRTRP